MTVSCYLDLLLLGASVALYLVVLPGGLCGEVECDSCLVCAHFFSARSALYLTVALCGLEQKSAHGIHIDKLAGGGTGRLEQAEKGGSSKPPDSAATEWKQDIYIYMYIYIYI